VRSKLGADLYRLGVAVAGIAVLAAIAPGLPGGGGAWVAAAAFALAGLASLQFPLSLSLTNRVTVASSVFFAALLVLPPALAALVAGSAFALDSAVSVTRRIRSPQPRPPAMVIGLALCFNSAVAVLSVSIPALLFPGARIASVAQHGWAWTLASAAAAGILMYLLNLTLIGIAVALRTGNRPLHAIAVSMRPVRMEFAALYTLGLVAGIGLQVAPWAVLALVPVVVGLHSLLERAVRLRRETIAAVERMADLVDRRDPYTADHSRRVAQYVVAIATELGMPPSDVDQLRLAATVHDIGKIEVPDEILLKDGRLTPAEKAVMDQHPRAGYELLRQFSEYARVRELVLTHHERYDGKGYPSRIRASALPLIAQVIPVADSLDAMTSARPYRAALSWSVALGELRRGRGSQWHPGVVDAALKVFGGRAAAEPQAA